MADEERRGFQVIRGSALIAVCAAFEYLLKATFVSQAERDPKEAAALFAGLKIKVLASDVLGRSKTEQWFAIADEVFGRMSEPQMHKRVRKFLLDFTYLPAPLPGMTTSDTQALEKAFDGIESDKLDEAFLTRNCLVHNGG